MKAFLFWQRVKKVNMRKGNTRILKKTKSKTNRKTSTQCGSLHLTWQMFKKGFLNKAEGKCVTKFCYRVITTTQNILLCCRTLHGLDGNVLGRQFRNSRFEFFRVSPNYSSFGSLISLLARRKAKSVFMLQAQTPARYLFFNTIQNTNFHSNFPPMLSPNTCHYSAGQLRGRPEPVTSAALQETKGTAHPTVASS